MAHVLLLAVYWNSRLVALMVTLATVKLPVNVMSRLASEPAMITGLGVGLCTQVTAKLPSLATDTLAPPDMANLLLLLFYWNAKLRDLISSLAPVTPELNVMSRLASEPPMMTRPGVAS